jgi:hypothetical protein
VPKTAEILVLSISPYPFFILNPGSATDKIVHSSTDTDGIPQWEQELQQELQDYEMVDDNVDDADIENEILQQLEEEATDPK